MQITEISENKIETLSLPELKEYLYPGDIKAIARITGYDPSYIWYVIRGVRNSSKIDQAIRERVRQNFSLLQFRKESSNG